MYWIIKLVQSLVKALNSEGTPGQVAAGMAVGACLGLTPLMNLHNLLVVLAILFFRVSVPGAMLGWMIFTPVGFLLDLVFDRVGRALLLDAEQDYPETWINDAIDIAVEQNKRSWAYCEAILKRWQTDGKDDGRRNGSGISADKDAVLERWVNA